MERIADPFVTVSEHGPTIKEFDVLFQHGDSAIQSDFCD